MAALLVAGCGGGSSAPAAGAPSSGSPSPTASPTPTPTPTPTGPNGIASLSATAALAKVSAAASSQTSVRVSGAVVESRHHLRIDVEAGLETGQGTLRINGGLVSLRLVSGTLYFNADLKGLTGLGVSKASASGAAGKWIGGQASTSPLSAFVSFADLVTALLRPNGGVTTGPTKTIHGVRALALINKAKKGGGTLYVATSGEPLPVEAVNAKTHEVLSFSNWGAALSVLPPPKAITVPAPTQLAPSATPAAP
jgi:hypothetical protein